MTDQCRRHLIRAAIYEAAQMAADCGAQSTGRTLSIYLHVMEAVQDIEPEEIEAEISSIIEGHRLFLKLCGSAEA